MVQKKVLVKKSFFGKGNCFKYLLYEDMVMFHFGLEQGNDWSWKKVKMNDSELGEILLVLEGRQSETKFFHSFGAGDEKQTTQIFVNTKEDAKGRAFFIKVKELSKSFNVGEQRVLESLLQHALVRLNLEL